MSSQELKLNITGLLKEVENTAILQQIRDILLKEKKHKTVIGFTKNGEAMDKETYRQKVVEAIERIDSGKYISQEDLQNEAKNW